MNRPEILFLDEPTAGLDPQSRRELRDEIARLKKDGRTVLLTTHDVDEAERLCERVAIMDGGQIIATGEPRALAAQSASMQSVSLSTKPRLDAGRLTGIPGMVDVASDGGRITFRTPDARRTLRDLTALLEAVWNRAARASRPSGHTRRRVSASDRSGEQSVIRGALRQCVVSMRLYFRNPLAMSYGYLFPTLFLAAYWGLYRFDRVPLVRHIGELLTVTVLGGACFGLPTTLVSEREKGVWRRYRLMPVPVGALVASTIAARYVLVVTAGLLQLGLAMLIGMPRPQHPFDLWVAFTVVAFAFLGCGLVIAMMADTVPAVQALGQTIFLPMLIIGGIAVPIATLPEWAQHASAFFPGATLSRHCRRASPARESAPCRSASWRYS